MANTIEWPKITPREDRVKNAPGSWNNPTGQDLRKLCEDVWVMERGYEHFGMDVGGKMTIIRLPDDRLFVHSALPLTPELKYTVDSLGTVSAVVAGNAEHVDFIKCWKGYYLEATCLAPPGLKAKREDVPFDDEVAEDGTLYERYKGEAGSIRQIYVEACSLMSETVFFHVPSKTLMVTDIIFTFPHDNIPFPTRLAKFGLRNLFVPVVNAFFVKDKGLYRGSLRKIADLEFEKLVPCHDEILTENALRSFKGWHGLD